MKQLSHSIFSLLLLFLCLRSLPAQVQENRVALVVGNSHYKYSPLANPSNDAREMAMVLSRAGFTVTVKYDLNVLELNNAVTDFTQTFTGSNTVALFYYAGHGIGSKEDGKNYLIPIEDEEIKPEKINYQCVPLDRISAKMKLANNYINIIILDACRKYAFQGIRGYEDAGLLPFDENLSELLVAYATQPGNTASDQPNSVNGLYTGKILKYITTPGLEIKDLFFEVGKEVKEQSRGQQTPSMVSNLTQKFYFFGGPPQKQQPVQSEDADHDGVPDNIDRCPNDFGPVNLQGCPDSDMDGVIDLLDQCPQVAGVLAKNGCPDEIKNTKRQSGWSSGIGVNYSRFGAHYTNDPYIKSVYFNSYQLDYFFVNKIGGFVSFGTYTGRYDLTSSSNYPILNYTMGVIGPGVQILNSSSDLKGYAFAGLMLFFGKKSDNEVFGYPTNYLGYQFILSGSYNHLGLKAGFITGFEQVKGFTAGMYYSF